MNRKEQIEILESHLTDDQAKYLNLEVWEKLPTEEQFEDWMDEFNEVWDMPEEDPGDNEALIYRVIEKLDDVIYGK